MRRDGYQVHPQGHAALTQQPLPISIKALLKHLFPFSWEAEELLPGLTWLHLRYQGDDQHLQPAWSDCTVLVYVLPGIEPLMCLCSSYIENKQYCQITIRHTCC